VRVDINVVTALPTGVKARAALEPIERGDEREEDLLDQIVRVLRRVSHPSRGPIEPARLLLNDGVQGGGIATAQRGELIGREGHSSIIGGFGPGVTAAVARLVAL
jgi:hypothetical protein